VNPPSTLSLSPTDKSIARKRERGKENKMANCAIYMSPPANFQRYLTLPQVPSPTSLSCYPNFSNSSVATVSPSSSSSFLPQLRNDTIPFSSYSRSYSRSTVSRIKKSELLEPLLLVPGDESRETTIILPVECGLNRGFLQLSKLCQGSKGQCILHHGTWLTPNEFQYVSGRVTAKDWKRSIRHNGKSLKLLISKGAFRVHSPLCDCGNHEVSPEGSNNNSIYNPL